MSARRPQEPIPVGAARDIAERYRYDQVVILARRVGDDPEPHGEHITTYGRDRQHCDVAALMGDTLKRIAGWPDTPDPRDIIRGLIAIIPEHLYDLDEPAIARAEAYLAERRV